jgi:hypothetical protein
MENQNGETEASIDQRIVPLDGPLGQYHADQLNELYDHVVANAKATFEAAMALGAKLTAFRTQCGHGNWESWLKANVKFSPRTARRYTDLYSFRSMFKSDSVSDLTSAYRRIMGIKSKKRAVRKSHSSAYEAPDPSTGESSVESEPEMIPLESSTETVTVNVTPVPVSESTDPLLERWHSQIQKMDSPEFDEEEFRKKIGEKYGTSYYPPFCLRISSPDDPEPWIEALTFVRKASLSDADIPFLRTGNIQ